MPRDYKTLLIYVLLSVAGSILVWQASVKAPTGDEVAQLAAGLATVQTGLPGYYRVNPPLHKIISGMAVELVCAPSSPIPSNPARLPPGVRQEFEYSEILIAQNQKGYRQLFFVGRVVRVPIILGAGLLLLNGFPRKLKTASMVACFLFLTSPMTLGHGWCIMPDALSGCAMILLLSTSVSWLNSRNWRNFTLVGLAWGLALGTKFTFCPLYILWPIGLVIHEILSRNACLKTVAVLFISHLLQGLIAWAILLALYGFEQPLVPLKDHQFCSQRFADLVQSEDWDAGKHSILGHLLSPFPKQFLVGIDEQQLDLEHGFPTYVLGQWYPDGVWWYYFLGILIKEQLIFLVGLAVCPVAALSLLLWRKNEPACEESDESEIFLTAQRRACAAVFGLSLFVLVAVLAILSSHPKMALNVRYLFPGFPAAYLMIGAAWQWLVEQGRLVAKFGIALAIAASGMELFSNAPHFFAYANPLWGGAARIPPALHDTNFDGGQDLWILENYVIANSGDQTERYFIFHSRLPSGFFNTLPTPPPDFLDHFDLATPVDGTIEDRTKIVELVVMRGAGYPAPWTMPRPKMNDVRREKLIQLLQSPPNIMLTPTVFVYRRCIVEEKQMKQAFEFPKECL